MALAKVPVPLEVQVIPALLLALEPAVIFTAPVLEQVDTAVPAEAVAAVTTETVTVFSIVALHPVPSEANTLNVVEDDKFPVGRLIVPPVPATAEPTFVLEASRN